MATSEPSRQLSPPPDSSPSPHLPQQPPPTSQHPIQSQTILLPHPSPPLPPASSTNPRRLPPPCWSHDETVALIDAYCDKWYALRRGNLKATHWQEVADAVSSRCPTAPPPPKTAVQCRHKMEKLRKRYRTELQRARSLPVSRFISSWVHFNRMDAMEKGPSAAKPEKDEDEEDGEDEEDDDEEDGHNFGAIPGGRGRLEHKFKNGGINTGGSAGVHGMYDNNNGIGVDTQAPSGSRAGGSVRIKIPSGVSIAQPGVAGYSWKFDRKFNLGDASPNINNNSSINASPSYGVSSRTLRDGKREREKDVVEEMVGAIKLLGDGFVRMEQLKMEMAREIEAMRMEMEMKRTEMILESQQRIVEAFAKAVSERKRKALKRIPSPEA